MSTPDTFLPHGGYRSLRSYIVAEAIYDATVVFCRRFHCSDRRMTDQMVQAARSGVRNISEGSGAGATSRKSEMTLTNVARASLADELLPDYEAFLRQRGLRLWLADSREAMEMRRRLAKDDAGIQPVEGKVQLTGLSGLTDFVEKAEAELAGNAMVCVVHQCVYLLKRQMAGQAKQFQQEGGFSEKLTRARLQNRRSGV